MLPSLSSNHACHLKLDSSCGAWSLTDDSRHRFSNVAITVSANIDKVNTSADGCNSCNVVLGSDNAALVVEDTFWLWAEDSSFIVSPEISEGQRPSVILRGTDIDGHNKSVDTVYLVLFR